MDAALDYIMAEGEARGTEKGEENVNRLGLLLLEHGRIDEFLKSLSDKKLQKKLFAEFGIEKEQ